MNIRALLVWFVLASTSFASDFFLSRDHAITLADGIVRYRAGTGVLKQPDGKFLMPDRRVVELPAALLVTWQIAEPPAAPVSIVPATPTAKAAPAPAKATPKPAPKALSQSKGYVSPLGTPKLDMRRRR